MNSRDPVRKKLLPWAIAVAMALFALTAWFTRPAGDVDGHTDGWGLGVNLAGAVKVRYDTATRPEARL